MLLEKNFSRATPSVSGTRLGTLEAGSTERNTKRSSPRLSRGVNAWPVSPSVHAHVSPQLISEESLSESRVFTCQQRHRRDTLEFGHGHDQPVHFMPSAHAAHTAASLTSAR